MLMVLVTDESGDDGADVEEARQALKRNNIPLYVIGRQSLFGYPYAHHRFEDPVTHDVYHPLIRRGPETADLELYQWDGLYDRWDEQPSGLRPLRAGPAHQGIRRHLLRPAQRGVHAGPPSRAGLLDHPAQGVPARVRQPPDLRREAQRLPAAPDPARHRPARARTSSTAATSRSSPPSWSRRPSRRARRPPSSSTPCWRSRSGSRRSARSAIASPRSAGRPTTT